MTQYNEADVIDQAAPCSLVADLLGIDSDAVWKLGDDYFAKHPIGESGETGDEVALHLIDQYEAEGGDRETAQNARAVIRESADQEAAAEAEFEELVEEMEAEFGDLDEGFEELDEGFEELDDDYDDGGDGAIAV